MADAIPTGVPSRANEIVITAIACSILSATFVTLRMYTKLRINRAAAIGWDDYAAIITLPFCIAYGTLLIISTRYGMGLHARDFPGNLREQYQEWIFIASCTYLPSLLGYKMSILLFYLRVFNINKTFRLCTWLVMFITFGYLFSNFWSQIFGCRPIAKYWKPRIPGHCILMFKADYGYGSLNFITDLLIFVLPLPMVWRMQLTLKEKLGVSLVFMVGSVNWAVAIVRFVCAVEDIAPETARGSLPRLCSGASSRHLASQSGINRPWSSDKRKASEDGQALKDVKGQSDKIYINLEHGRGRSPATSNKSFIGGQASEEDLDTYSGDDNRHG